MFTEKNEGKTYSCQHDTPNTSGICDKCLGKEYPLSTFSSETQKELLAWKDAEIKKVSKNNLGLIRQYFGEQPKDKTFTAGELYKIFETLSPLMTKEQEEKLIKLLKKL